MAHFLEKLGWFAVLHRSTNFLDAFRIALVRLIAPNVHLTYSQFGEDAILKVFFWGQKPGFYIDVGCNHPTKMNNTYLLYQRGWRGINIDGNQSLINKYKRCRKRDTNLAVIISDTERPVLFHVSDNDHVSTIDESYKAQTNWEYPKSQQVQAYTLNTILGRHLPEGTAIDLLCVDVEGHDLQVLRSIDLAMYKPTMIVVEMHHFTLETAGSFEVYNYLLQQGYKLKYFSVINGYFVRD